MRGTTTIEFDFEFTYQETAGKDRKLAKTNTVTLCAPSLQDFALHTFMVRSLKAGGIGFATAIQGLIKDQGDGVEDDDDAAADENPMRAIDLLAVGLGDDFDTFCARVKKELTNKKRLAYVGDEHPLKDQTWDAIAEAGGLDAVMQIISAFADFFMAAPSKSQKKTGKGVSTSSA